MQLALWTEPTEARGSMSSNRGAAVPQPRRHQVLAEQLASAAAFPLRSFPAPRPKTTAELERDVGRFVEEAHAANTRRAYQSDWDAFTRWCSAHALEPLPAATHTLELYLAHLAALGRRPSTLRRARIAIGLAHGHAGAPRPDQHPRLRALERGIGRTFGVREEGAVALLDTEVAQAVKGLGSSPRGERDRALLLLGFAGAFRASELAGLNVDDITLVAEGLNVRVRRSKEDQLGRGAVTRIPRGTSAATCPVRALQVWIGRVGRPAGPLFRVIQGGTVEHQRISTRCVSRAVQRAVEGAGLGGHYSAHSLRAGLATSAYAHGATEREIQLQGRWRDPRSVQRYIQLERVPGRRNVAEGLL